MSMTSDVFLVEYPDERVAAYYVYEWDYRTFKVSPIGFTTEEPTLTKMAFMALASDRSRKRLRNELKELTCQHTTT